MRERDVEWYLVDCTRLAGGEIRKVKWIGRRGAPDRRLMHPTLGCWVEVKRPGKGLDPHQAREIERMREMGEKVMAFDSIEQIDEYFRGYI